MKYFVLFLFLFGLSFPSYSQNNEIREISGKITYLNAPLKDVNITIKGTTKGTITDGLGNYTIKAKVGEVIQYSHVAYKTVNIIVEDVTRILNVEMVEQQNELEEVTVVANGKLGKAAEYAKRREEKFFTAFGIMSPTGSVGFIDGDDINPGAIDILDAIDGKVAGVIVNRLAHTVRLRDLGSISMHNRPPIWDVDGLISDSIPTVDPVNIVSIHILKSMSSTVRYGGQGAGGVIVVNTKYGSFGIKTERDRIARQYYNEKFYANDAVTVDTSRPSVTIYGNVLAEFNDKQKAYAYYNEQFKDSIDDYSAHIGISKLFASYYEDTNMASEILTGLAEKHHKNPEILKAIAYQMRDFDLKLNAVELYEKIFKLRPNYAQSYRDLANAYLENDQFKKAWRLYMSYLLQGRDVTDSGIGNMIYNEMEFLYYVRKDRAEIKEKFVPKSKNLADFQDDVRLVFEWNTSEAEFNLEFVNPELRAYVFEHSLASNGELITDEKEKGYSSKEFIIDKLGDGVWLVNLTYHGNKKPEPTYFKVTQYLNWGRPNQREKVNVYELTPNQNRKLQLLKLDKLELLASN